MHARSATTAASYLPPANLQELAGRRILLGLTGGVACYKAAELCRLLVKAGAQVQVMMSEGACHFITPTTMQALSGRPVFSSQWDEHAPDHMAHIRLGRETDLILLAPCSADSIARLAQGRADELVSLTCLARPAGTPLLIAPAMNREMYAHPATQRNLAQIAADGAHVLGVGCGEQACGEVGDGRMLEPWELYEAVAAQFAPRILAGQQVLITAGPTYEAIDPVRGITNRSSGKMGFALARAAQQAGANVTLIAGPVHLPTPYGVQRVDVQSARDMLQAVQQHVPERGIFIATAAVADWRSSDTAAHKIKKDAAANRPPCNLPKTQTFSPPSRAARRHKVAHCSAWALPPKPKTCWPTPRPNGCASRCHCSWPTWGLPPSGRTTMPCSSSTRTAQPNCPVPTNTLWHSSCWRPSPSACPTICPPETA